MNLAPAPAAPWNHRQRGPGSRPAAAHRRRPFEDDQFAFGSYRCLVALSVEGVDPVAFLVGHEMIVEGDAPPELNRRASVSRNPQTGVVFTATDPS